MKNASKLIRDWSKNNGNQSLPTHWTLTRGKLGLKAGKYCHLHGKGWHTTVVLQWLLDFTDSLPNVPAVLKSALWSANTCLTILHESRKHSQLLHREVIEQCVHVGIFFQKCYLRLHLQYRRFCPYLLFNIRPKFHLLTHFFLTCEKERNPLCSSTWMDETWIGQIMRLAGSCQKRTVQLTALQRYCTGLVLHELVLGEHCVTMASIFSFPGLKAELQAALAALRSPAEIYLHPFQVLIDSSPCLIHVLACGFMTFGS